MCYPSTYFLCIWYIPESLVMSYPTTASWTITSIVEPSNERIVSKGQLLEWYRCYTVLHMLSPVQDMLITSFTHTVIKEMLLMKSKFKLVFKSNESRWNEECDKCVNQIVCMRYEQMLNWLKDTKVPEHGAISARIHMPYSVLFSIPLLSYDTSPFVEHTHNHAVIQSPLTPVTAQA